MEEDKGQSYLDVELYPVGAELTAHHLDEEETVKAVRATRSQLFVVGNE